MRIGFYTNCYKPRINGVVRSIAVFRQALLNLGHEVHLFAPAAPGYFDDEPDVYRYPALPWDSNALYRLALPFSRRLGKLSADLHLDVIHSHHPAMLGWVAARHARRAGIPLVFTLHSQYQHYGAYLPVGGRVVRAVPRQAVVRYMALRQRIIAPTSGRAHQVLRMPSRWPGASSCYPIRLSRWRRSRASPLASGAHQVWARRAFLPSRYSAVGREGLRRSSAAGVRFLSCGRRRGARAC